MNYRVLCVPEDTLPSFFPTLSLITVSSSSLPWLIGLNTFSPSLLFCTLIPTCCACSPSTFLFLSLSSSYCSKSFVLSRIRSQALQLTVTNPLLWSSLCHLVLGPSRGIQLPLWPVWSGGCLFLPNHCTQSWGNALFPSHCCFQNFLPPFFPKCLSIYSGDIRWHPTFSPCVIQNHGFLFLSCSLRILIMLLAITACFHNVHFKHPNLSSPPSNFQVTLFSTLMPMTFCHARVQSSDYSTFSHPSLLLCSDFLKIPWTIIIVPWHTPSRENPWLLSVTLIWLNHTLVNPFLLLHWIATLTTAYNWSKTSITMTSLQMHGTDFKLMLLQYCITYSYPFQPPLFLDYLVLLSL